MGGLAGRVPLAASDHEGSHISLLTPIVTLGLDPRVLRFAMPVSETPSGQARE